MGWPDWPYFLCLALTVYPAAALLIWGPRDDGVIVGLCAVILALGAGAYWLRRVRRVATARATRAHDRVRAEAGLPDLRHLVENQQDRAHDAAEPIEPLRG